MEADAAPAAAKPASAPPSPLEADPGRHWTLDPSIDFLNHGCFGARPRVVAEAQARWRDRFNARPIELLDRQRDALVEEAKEALGGFIGMQTADFGFVTNATEGVNAVLRSLDFAPGDELLTTNHVYNAVRMTMRELSRRAGAVYREIEVPFPVRSPDDVVNAIAAHLTERTRLLVIDHITSPTAVLFPVAAILELANRHGIDVLVDGAHAPGMVDLHVESLGAAYYTGNLHKWMCAPLGAGFLWVRKDRQAGIHPPTISHFLDQGLADEFAWQGTRDITPWLCVKDAIAFGRSRPGGWPAIMTHNHALVTWVQELLAARWSVAPGTPLDGTMLGAMATLALPEEALAAGGQPEAFQAKLYDRFRIEAPVIDWNGRWWIRPCCQVYNRPVQYERLAAAVLELVGR